MSNMPEAGDKAPDFKVINHEGSEKSIADYAGKWLVLYFYPKDNTPGCTTESKEFTSAKKDFSDLGATIVGASPDSCKSHLSFIAKQALSLELLSDHEKKLCEAYGVWQLKKNYGREYMGVVRSTFLINPEGEVVYRWTSVKVKGHVEAVLNKLKALQ